MAQILQVLDLNTVLKQFKVMLSFLGSQQLFMKVGVVFSPFNFPYVILVKYSNRKKIDLRIVAHLYVLSSPEFNFGIFAVMSMGPHRITIKYSMHLWNMEMRSCIAFGHIREE